MNAAQSSALRRLAAPAIVSVVTAVTLAQAPSTDSGPAPSTGSGLGSRTVQRSATAPYFPGRVEWQKQTPMEPIGASSTWRWHGFENAWVDLDGRRVQSMTGGQIVSQKKIDMARSPGPANDGYGYMNWFLNSGAKPAFANAPRSAVTFQGKGSNIIYIDWENGLVVVVRWIRQNAFNEFIGQVVGSLPATAR